MLITVPLILFGIFTVFMTILGSVGLRWFLGIAVGLNTYTDKRKKRLIKGLISSTCNWFVVLVAVKVTYNAVGLPFNLAFWLLALAVAWVLLYAHALIFPGDL